MLRKETPGGCLMFFCAGGVVIGFFLIYIGNHAGLQGFSGVEGVGGRVWDGQWVTPCFRWADDFGVLIPPI